MPVEILGTQITLWCFDAQNNSNLKIVIGGENDISDLKEAIKEKKPTDFAEVDADRLKLWRVNTADETISGVVLNDELKRISQSIRDAFGDVQGTNIRAVVTVPDKTIEKVIYYQYNQSVVISMKNSLWKDFVQLFNNLQVLFNIKGSISDYDFIISSKKVVLITREEFIEYIESHNNSFNNPVKILDGSRITYTEILGFLPTPSKLGEPHNWHIHNSNKAFCLNHRPPTASSSVPVDLYCPIFGRFKDRCKEDPGREDNTFTYNFCCEMARHFVNEEGRRNTANNLLAEYLKCQVEAIMLDENRNTDGTISTTNSYREINIEYKNESCSTNACAFLENCGYYLSFCRNQKNTDTNMPCFLVNIAGPSFVVYGAVLSDLAVVDPLTQIFHLIWLKDDEEMMLQLSRTFRALKLSLQDLHNYYNDIPQIFHRKYPNFPDFSETTLDGQAITYKVRINYQHGNYLLWNATLQTGNGQEYEVYVKAVKRKYYSLDAHRLLANGNHAPRIFGIANIPGEWLLVYMDHLKDYQTLNKIVPLTNAEELAALKAEITRVVKLLHNQNYVHGDLREGNILVRQDVTKNCGFDVKLIDFEWSGAVDSARYSHFMNHIGIDWPEGAEDGQCVTVEHDNIMLEQTFRKFN